MLSKRPLSFDLVVASVDRVEPLEDLLRSLERQTYGAFRVLLVDQNPDDRLAPLLARHPDLEIVRLRSPRGLSRARNAALPHLRADLVAFPDDDCTYADDLLERVAARFAHDPSLAGLSGRGADRDGRSSPSWKPDAAILDRSNLWNRAASYGLFLRRALVERVGFFDERLGLGAPGPWSSGEEIDYLLRALETGARIAYDPTLLVQHAVRDDDPAIGYRDGASVGYLLRKHRYGPRAVGRMLVRPLGGAALALARADAARARYHLAAARGRVRGYVRGGARRR